jgi:hypothetical protein
MLPSAETCASKIETQYRNGECVEGFCSPVNDFIVESAAKKRMWMADEDGDGWRAGSRASPEYGFETASRSIEEKTAGIVGDLHLEKEDKVYLKNRFGTNDEEEIIDK